MVNKTDQEIMRANNTNLVLQELFNSRQTSRIEIAKQLNLHKSTISSIYQDLFEFGYIEELGQGEATKSGGRRPELIRFNKDMGYVIGFDLGGRNIRYTIANLKGNVIFSGKQAIKSKKAKKIVEQFIDLINEIRSREDLPETKYGLLGMAIGIHGIIVNRKITYSPFISDLENFDLVKEINEKIKKPIILENEANMTAVFVRDYHDYPQKYHYSNLLSVNIRSGIGAGMIIFDQLQRGDFGVAGEIGRMVIDVSDNTPKRLEDLTSEDAVIEQIKEIKKQSNVQLEQLVDWYQNGDAKVVALMDDWAMLIATAIYNLSTVSAPQAVFINSRILAMLPELFEKLTQRFDSLHHASLQPPKVYLVSNSIKTANQLGGVAQIIRLLLGLPNEKLHFYESE